jgi:hypothetical protein
MDLLERVAIDEYNANTITLDTAAYRCTTMDGDLFEDKTMPNRTIAWYKGRGYEEFKVSAQSC